MALVGAGLVVMFSLGSGLWGSSGTECPSDEDQSHLLLLLHVEFVCPEPRWPPGKVQELLFIISPLLFLVLVLSGCFRVLQAAACRVSCGELRSVFRAAADQLCEGAM